jgi:hypothetical protein
MSLDGVKELITEVQVRRLIFWGSVRVEVGSVSV